MDFVDYLNYTSDIYDDDEAYNYPSRRYIRDAENRLEIYDAGEFRRRYRLSKDSVVHILFPLLEINNSDNNRGLPLTPILQVLIALRFYATGNFQIVCGDLHKNFPVRSIKDGSTLYYSKRLALKSGQYIKFPGPNERIDVKRKFHHIAGFPGVIGCVDCTHIPIKNPTRERGEIFRNRKGWFSINVQIVCGPGMEIYDIVVRWPGSGHDSRIFSNSRCSLRFEEGDLAGSGILVGDGGYAQTAFMYTPLSNPQTDAQHRYNRAHILTRNIIERVNGVLKRVLHVRTENYRIVLQIPAISLFLVPSCIIHICLRTNEPVLEPEVEIEDVPVYNAQDTARGSIIRSVFNTRHFS